MQVYEHLTLERKKNSNLKVNLTEVEAMITANCIRKFFERGLWITSFFYYLSKDGYICQARSMVTHYPKHPNAGDIHIFLCLIKRFHIVDILYDSIYAQYPINDAPIVSLELAEEVSQKDNDPVKTFLDDGSMGTFLDANTGLSPVENLEIDHEIVTIDQEVDVKIPLYISERKNENNLMSQVSNEIIFVTGYDMVRYMLKIFRPVLPLFMIKRVMAVYKRSLFVLQKFPMQLSMLSTDTYYLNLIKSIEYTFLPREYSIFFPNTQIKFPMMSFREVPENEDKYLYYMSWEEIYRMRLISRRFYNVVRDKIIAYQVFLMMEFKEDLPNKGNNIEQYSMGVVSDTDSIEKRDGRCAFCHLFVCSCTLPAIDCIVEYKEIISGYFNNNQVVAKFYRYIQDYLPDLTFPLAIAVGVMYCVRNRIYYKPNLGYLIPQIPALIMREVKSLYNSRIKYKPGLVRFNGLILNDRRREISLRQKLKRKLDAEENGINNPPNRYFNGLELPIFPV